MFVTVPPELLVALHGKFPPSGSRGPLVGLPYGGGVAMIMWQWAVEARAAMAEAARIFLMEDISVLIPKFDLICVEFVGFEACV